MPEGNASRLAAKANKLYWGTNRPAGHLADELGVSRSKFYALIEPLIIDVKCSECGEPLAFGSRTDREAGKGRCPACGSVSEIPAGAGPARAPATLKSPSAEAPGRSVGIPRLPLPGSRELWLTAIAGVAVSLLVTGWWRRR